MNYTFSWKTFDDLSAAELYAVLRLRQDVFVIEQNCIFPDIDGRDQDATHLLVTGPGEILVGYCRLFGPSETDCAASVGRLVTSLSVRKTGLGHAILRNAAQKAAASFPHCPIRIAAQSHLIAFYRQHGFKVVGEEYIEDGIPHIDLIRQPDFAADI